MNTWEMRLPNQKTMAFGCLPACAWLLFFVKLLSNPQTTTAVCNLHAPISRGVVDVWACVCVNLCGLYF